MKLDINPITGKLDMTGEQSSNDSSVLYSSDVPTTEAVGGVPKGATFDNVPITKVIDQILHKPVAPTVTLAPSFPAGAYEVGSVLANSIVAKVTCGSSNIKKVEFYAGSKLTATDTTSAVSGGNVSFACSTSQSVTYKVVVTDVGGLTASATVAYSFLRPVYWGLSSSVPSSITGLTLVVPSAKSGDFTAKYSAFDNKRIVFATPGAMTKALNPSLFDITKSFSLKVVKVLCRDGQNVNYNVYYTEPSSQLADYPVKYSFSTLS